MSQIHTISYRAYFEDTDAGGVVYHANYLNFCERARTELLLKGGYSNLTLQQDTGVIFVVRHIEMDYLKPLRLEDEFTILTTISEIKRTSVVFDQAIKKEEDIVFKAKVTLVCVGSLDVRPVKIPADLHRAFSTYLTEQTD